MKLFIRMGVLIALLYLQGCGGCIKHSNSQHQAGAATDVSGIPVPIANNNLIINNVNDLTGYWAGAFGPAATDSAEYEMDDPEFETINISLDKINGTAVNGHTVLDGKVRFFSCNMQDRGGKYYFKFKSGANEKAQGFYTFAITRGDSVLKGDWNPHNDKIPSHSYRLTKKLFRYNPNVKLEAARYVDYKKTVVVKQKIDTDSYDQQKFATTSDDVIKFNPSSALLTKDQVANLKKADLLVLRNSIFARHGYIFKKEPLDLFFSQQSWYVPIKPDVTAELTDTEKKNIELLMRFEKTAQEYYDTFGR